MNLPGTGIGRHLVLCTIFFKVPLFLVKVAIFFSRIPSFCQGASIFQGVHFTLEILRSRMTRSLSLCGLNLYDTFKHGLDAFRAKQTTCGDKRFKTNANVLSNKDVSSRYCAPLNLAIKQNRVGIRLPMYESTRPGNVGLLRHCHIHDLRAIYASYVCRMFVNAESDNRVLMRCLLHETLAESLSYTNVRLENDTPLSGCLGEFA